MGNLQRFCRWGGYLDDSGQPVRVDEVFGPKTAGAVRHFQEANGRPMTGLFDPTTRSAATSLGFIPFVQARHCRILFPREQVRSLIVIHTIECLETSLTAAEDNALWFAGLGSAPPAVASAHYFIDQDSVVQTVRDSDEAWHANQVNGRALGIEHAGFASQTAIQWDDDASKEILDRSARLTARLAMKFNIPRRKVTSLGVRNGVPGFCGHVDVTAAYQNPRGHTDPGTGFPWEKYMGLVDQYASG